MLDHTQMAQRYFNAGRRAGKTILSYPFEEPMHITQNPIYKHGTEAAEIDIDKITWREIPSDDRNIFFDWVLEETIRKNQAGQEIYGDTFAGDPLIHLAEELLDGLFYVYVAFRQRQALEVAAQEATNDLQRLKNSHCTLLQRSSYQYQRRNLGFAHIN